MTATTEITTSPAADSEPAPIPPMAHFQRRANQWLEAVRAAAPTWNIRPANVAGVDIDVFDALRSNLILSGAAALRALHPTTLASSPAPPSAPSAEPRSWWDAWRLRAYFIKRWAARRFLTPPFTRTANRPLVLAFPRLPGHFNDLWPVASELQTNHDVPTLFAALDREMARRIAARGAAAVNAFAYRPGPSRDVRGSAASFLSQVEAALDALRSADTMDFNSAERAALAAAASTTLHRDAAEALNVAHAFIGLVRRFRPELTLVANPYTFEGRLLSLVSRHAGVPTVALEHGSIFPGSPHWQKCPSDLVCAWGDVSRRALLACGVADERIAVTGGPRYDEVFRRAQASTERLDPAQATVLVATSGPGDQVSPAQHRDFIAALFAAAAQTPDVRWVVKLHRKDAIANYELSQAGRRSNVSIIPAEYGRDGLEIFDYLRSARALVTITSSAAFDALAVGVPVISFDVWPAAYKRTDVEFLEQGCATTVRTAQELADEVARAWRLERDPAVEAAAARYVDEHFAHRGRAAQAVARRIKDLLDAAPQTSHAERR